MTHYAFKSNKLGDLSSLEVKAMMESVLDLFLSTDGTLETNIILKIRPDIETILNKLKEARDNVMVKNT